MNNYYVQQSPVPYKAKMQDSTEVGEAIDVLLIVAKDYATIYNA